MKVANSKLTLKLKIVVLRRKKTPMMKMMSMKQKKIKENLIF